MVKYVTCGDIMFKIGNIVIKGNVVLAPMAGVCNSAFRKIIKEMGCPLVYAEMVSDKGLIFDSKKTKNMLYFEECKRSKKEVQTYASLAEIQLVIEGTSGHVTSQSIEANQVIHKGDSLSITLS